MDRKTFLGAMSSDVISQMAISKSIWGNLNSLSQDIVSLNAVMMSYTMLSSHGLLPYLLKNRGIRKPSDLPPGVVPPNLGVPCCLGIEIRGFI